ncbi:DUF3179 domain-containing protein [uncultured Maribacter sp.]|uniref:DUF3179 domain-containing protein n=1 Tax=uncultured Maribacter sp. TaxID=431308 RepID=UPI0026381037|nr:DUF3179 domain-containing protein [uncultured Maribacter sp.]
MMKKGWLLLLMVSGLWSCSSSNTNDSSKEGDRESSVWTIPKEEVLDGGPGRDGIPALENPNLINVSEVNFLADSDLVIGFQNGGDVRAYPHIILDWHEIINDNIGDVSLAVTYCPLTGTGIGWNRIVNGKETTFGVSGLLYNTNLIPFDRETSSNWSQILNESVNGELLGEKVGVLPLFETTWGVWKNLFPNSKVVSTNTGFSRTYGTSPYGDYNTNNNRFLFPVEKDSRLPLKERVYAVINNDKAKAYRFSDFSQGAVIKDNFEGETYLIVGNADFMVSFLLDANTTALEFEYVFSGTEVIVKDDEGNEWSIFGEAISGPRAGEFLKPTTAFKGFWFSFPAFYETTIYNN